MHFRYYFASVLVAIFFLHITYIMNGFVWLDHGDIEFHRAIVPLSELGETVNTRFGDTGFYRPLVTIFHSIDAALFSFWAPGFHLTNLLLHIAVCAVIPLFLSCFFTLSRREKLFTIFIFGIMPVGWLPVGVISYRQEMLLAIFTMLSIYFHTKARTSGNNLATFMVSISFLLALFSKESAIVIIPLCILLWEKISTGKKTSLYTIILLEVFIVAMYLILRFQAVPEIWRAAPLSLSFFEQTAMRFFVIGRLLMDLIMPVLPNLSDTIKLDQSTFTIGISLFIALAIIFYIVWNHGLMRNSSKILVLLGIFLIPVFSIFPIPRLGSAHYAYLAGIIFSAGLVLLVKAICRKWPRIKIAIYLCISVWICIMIISTFFGGYRFKNDFTLFKSATEQDQNYLEGHFYLGGYYLKNNLLKLAEVEYTRSLTHSAGIVAYNEDFSALNNLAIVYMRQQKLDKAQQALEKAAKLTNENNSILLQNKIILAQAYHKKGQNKKSIAILKQIIPNVSSGAKDKIYMLIKQYQK